MFLDDSDLGVDFGVIELTHYYRTHLEKNGVRPFSQDMWSSGKETFDTHLIFGAPRDLYEATIDIPDSRKSLMSVVTVPATPLKREDIPDAPDTKYPWLFFKVKGANRLKDITGMSGGPVLGLKADDRVGVRYWLIGLQSRWREKSRISYVCPTRIFMPQFELYLRNHAPLKPSNNI